MKTKCIIVDDEPLAIRVIESHLEKIPEIMIIAKCSNALQAIEILRNNSVDLIFLDIQMPELSGLEFLKSIQNPTEVIFTTAFRNYAIEAYEFDVIDYLLKPITFERILKSINKYYQRHSNTPNIVNVSTSQSVDSAHIYVKKNKTIFKILIKDIQYINSLKDYVKIFTTEEVYITKQKIGTLEKMLPELMFIRVHNSYIVNIQHISSISPVSIGIKDEKIPIGRSFKNFTLKKLDYYHNI